MCALISHVAIPQSCIKSDNNNVLFHMHKPYRIFRRLERKEMIFTANGVLHAFVSILNERATAIRAYLAKG